MTRKETAISYIQLFCEGRVPELGELLAEDFRFQGPLVSSGSKEAYLASLKADPPGPGQFHLHRAFDDGEEVCLVYDYQKSSGSLLMVQWTRFSGPKIKEIILVFDGRVSAHRVTADPSKPTSYT